jgi:hypothetical protein
MYLATRRAQLTMSHLRDAIGWATQMTEHVHQVTGVPTSLWNRVYSAGTGTLVWTAWVPDMTAAETFNDKLMVDERFMELLEQGVGYVIPGTLDDTLAQLIHPTELPDPPRQIDYAAVVTTTCANGRLAEGMALGVEIAQKAEELTGVPTAFLAGSTGNYGNITWITGCADAAELDRTSAALLDPQFIELVDQKAGRAYTDTPGASLQELYRRIV